MATGGDGPLTLEAREAVRNYTLKLFVLPTVVLTILGYFLGVFITKEAEFAGKGAALEATEEALKLNEKFYNNYLTTLENIRAKQNSFREAMNEQSMEYQKTFSEQIGEIQGTVKRINEMKSTAELRLEDLQKLYEAGNVLKQKVDTLKGVEGKKELIRSFVNDGEMRSDIVTRVLTDAKVYPVGMVVPFFLTQQEIKQLYPNWLPADGREVTVDGSPLLGKELPNLSGRMILGAAESTDIMLNAVNEGGAHLDKEASLAKSTYVEKYVYGDKGKPMGLQGGEFVIDTKANETMGAHHTHPYPPYRKLVYMVRVK